MPFWNSLDEVLKVYKTLSHLGLVCGIIAALSGVIGSLSAVGAFVYGNRKDEMSAVAANAELNRIRNAIHSFSARLYVEYSWAKPHTPLLENDQGGGIGEEDHLTLLRTEPSTNNTSEIYLKRTNQYQITRLSETSASFEVALSLRNQGFPLGNQTTELSQIKNIRAFIPVKNYRMNGQDHYELKISKVRLDLIINGKNRPFEFIQSESLFPKRQQSDALWGYLVLTRNIVFDAE